MLCYPWLVLTLIQDVESEDEDIGDLGTENYVLPEELPYVGSEDEDIGNLETENYVLPEVLPFPAVSHSSRNTSAFGYWCREIFRYANISSLIFSF